MGFKHINREPQFWPQRRIINLVATDAGMLNLQMTCGHVAWIEPYKPEMVAVCEELLERWYKGDRNIMYGCGGCEAGIAASLPIGVTLPIPAPGTENDPRAPIMEGKIIP